MRLKGEPLFQAELVLPQVAEVIFVDEAFFQAQMEVAELDLARVVVEEDVAWFPDAVGFAMNEELMR